MTDSIDDQGSLALHWGRLSSKGWRSTGWPVVRLLRQRGEDVTLHGSWDRAAGPERRTRRRGRFSGRANGRLISGIWSEHDLLVVPSRFEAYGIVFSEALAPADHASDGDHLPCLS